jgi:hypothetical protein
MRLPSFANPRNLVIEDEPEPEPIPDDIPITELAEQVVRGKVKLSRSQMKMLIEPLPYLCTKANGCCCWVVEGRGLLFEIGSGC